MTVQTCRMAMEAKWGTRERALIICYLALLSDENGGGEFPGFGELADVAETDEAAAREQLELLARSGLIGVGARDGRAWFDIDLADLAFIKVVDFEFYCSSRAEGRGQP